MVSIALDSISAIGKLAQMKAVRPTIIVDDVRAFSGFIQRFAMFAHFFSFNDHARNASLQVSYFGSFLLPSA